MDWSAELTRLVSASHPKLSTWPGLDRDYYWSAEQTEWATDVMFQSREEYRQREAAGRDAGGVSAESQSGEVLESHGLYHGQPKSCLSVFVSVRLWQKCFYPFAPVNREKGFMHWHSMRDRIYY